MNAVQRLQAVIKTHSVPCTVVGLENTAENKTGPGPCPPGAYTVGQQTSQRAGKISPVRTAQVTMGAPGRDRASHTLLQN